MRGSPCPGVLSDWTLGAVEQLNLITAAPTDPGRAQNLLPAQAMEKLT